MEVTDIDPEGDVVLACGRDGQRKRLRVCSKSLSRASPVLKALLSPRFGEGTELRSEGAVEIELADDDLEALTTICNVLHFHHDRVSFNLEPVDLTNIAQLADKYDLGTALRPIDELWISKQLQRLQTSGDRALLSAAYLLQHEQMFETVAERMVWEGDGLSFEPTSVDHPDNVAKLIKLVDALRDQRQKAIASLTASLERMLEQDMDLRKESVQNCEVGSCRAYVEKRVFFILSRMSDRSLWPFHQLHARAFKHILMALEECFADNDEIDKEDFARACGRSRDCRRYGESTMFWVLHLELLETAVDLRGAIKKVCYKCTREGKAPGSGCGHCGDEEH